jgi:outer membrane protein assembly complex protein YaeT
MNKALLFPVILVLIFSTQVPAVEPGRFRLSHVTFVGIHGVSPKELSKTLAARPQPFWKFWAKPPVITTADLEDDLLRIRQFYQAHGYYDTQVTYRIQEIKGKAQPRTSEKGKPAAPLIDVTFDVKEGPPVVIDRIDLKMEEKAEGLSQPSLLKSLPLKTGQIFHMDTYRKAKESLLKALGNKGYPLATLSGQVTVNTDDHLAQIHFDLKPGERCAFGSVTISGNDGYVNDVVIHRALAFKKGEAYATDKVEESQRNLFNLDIFKVALIKPSEKKESPSGSCEIPMLLQVKPKKRQSVKFGLGYGTEDGFRLMGAWTYRNLFGWGGKLTLSAKRSDLIENAQGEYVQPYFLGAKNTLLSKGGFEQDNFVSYTNRKVFADALFTRQLTKSWKASIGYTLQVNDVTQLNLQDPAEIAQIEEKNTYFISAMNMGLMRDTTDNTFHPTRGSISSASVEAASGTLGSKLAYFQPSLEFRKYKRIPWGTILAGRVRIEAIQNTEDTDYIPIFKRFFLGGADTVRGYSFQGLPPLDENGNPLGGVSSFLANLELRYPIYKELSGVVFVDMGVLDESPFRYNFGDMRYTSGLGLRYNTIVGPVRLDFGYKLNPPTRGDVGLLTNPDKPVEDRWHIYFSIGQTF